MQGIRDNDNVVIGVDMNIISVLRRNHSREYFIKCTDMDGNKTEVKVLELVVLYDHAIINTSF